MYVPAALLPVIKNIRRTWLPVQIKKPQNIPPGTTFSNFSDDAVLESGHGQACRFATLTVGLLRHEAHFFFLHPVYFPRTTLALPPSSTSDPGSQSGPSSPLPTTVRAFVFIARRIQLFLPSSTRVELCLPTLLLIALSAVDPSFLHLCRPSLEIRRHAGTAGAVLTQKSDGKKLCCTGKNGARIHNRSACFRIIGVELVSIAKIR